MPRQAFGQLPRLLRLSSSASESAIQGVVNSNQLSKEKSLILAIHGVSQPEGSKKNLVSKTQSELTPGREKETMKPSTEDRTEGEIHEMKGKIKETLGEATDDPDLKASGNAEKNAGKVQKWIGRAEKAVGK